MLKYGLILIGIITSGAAQIMLKKSSSFVFLKDFNFFKYFILGGLFYAFSFGIYAYVLKMFTISKISPVMTIGTMLLVVIAGALVFKEAVSVKQILGIVVGVIAIFLIIR